LSLEVTPEPRLCWQQLLGVSLKKVIDDQGQALEPAEIGVEAADASQDRAAPRPLVHFGAGVGVGPVKSDGGRLLSFRFKKAATPDSFLRDFSGIITARLRSESKPFVTVEDVFGSRQRTVDGPDGSSVRIINVAREPISHQELARVAIVPPANAVRAGEQPHFFASAGAVVFGFGDENGPCHELTLLDSRGAQLRLSCQSVIRNPAGAFECGLLHRPPDDYAPVKLVYSVGRSVTIDVPFTLRDVPLP
jgi:hypothetical protein